MHFVCSESRTLHTQTVIHHDMMTTERLNLIHHDIKTMTMIAFDKLCKLFSMHDLLLFSQCLGPERRPVCGWLYLQGLLTGQVKPVFSEHKNQPTVRSMASSKGIAYHMCQESRR